VKALERAAFRPAFTAHSARASLASDTDGAQNALGHSAFVTGTFGGSVYSLKGVLPRTG
jgi:hypothetical protein